MENKINLFYIIPCLVLMIIGFLSVNLVAGKWRQNIAFSSLLGGCAFLTLGGFLIAEAIGFLCLSAVLLIIALLFGYDNRG